MEKDNRGQSGEEIGANEKEIMDRRGFLIGLKKWSKIVIGGALLGSGLLNAGAEKEAEAAGWANRAGGGAAWANRAGGGAAVVKPGGGAAVVKPGGSAAAWANRAGGGVWANRGAAWANRGVAWVNRF